MPLQGHWRNQQTPVRRLAGHERRLVVVIASVSAALAVAVVAIAIATGSGGGTRQGCLRLTTGGSTGAYVISSCGADAVAFCRREQHGADALADRARRECHRARIAGR